MKPYAVIETFNGGAWSTHKTKELAKKKATALRKRSPSIAHIIGVVETKDDVRLGNSRLKEQSDKFGYIYYNAAKSAFYYHFQ
jgi:hypothetical protein